MFGWNTTPAFLTGSQVYGKPDKYSDIDLVVYAPGLDKVIRKLTKTRKGKPIVFGKLNLIICETEAEYDVWKDGTYEMVKAHRKKGAIFDTASATSFLNVYRELAHVKDRANSGSGGKKRPRKT